MAIQTPPPPISPRQMNLLRIVSSMAWSDGELAVEEVDVMLDRFSSVFAVDAAQKYKLQQDLRDYLMQHIPLEELVPKLQSTEERELVLRLGYEVILSSSRTPNEAKINDEEATAYEKLVSLLNLPPDTVQRIEAEVSEAQGSDEGMIESLTRQLEEFVQED